MKLHYDPLATSARSVTFFLFDQAIPFEEQLVSLRLGDQHSRNFAALNPNRQVPVLEDEGFVLTQSPAILKYVADRVGSPAYPSEPRARARVNEAMDWFATGLHLPYCVFLSYRRLLPPLRVLASVTQAELEALGQAMSARYLSVLDRHMLAGPSSAGRR
jgi:glutathione S-transferase